MRKNLKSDQLNCRMNEYQDGFMDPAKPVNASSPTFQASPKARLTFADAPRFAQELHKLVDERQSIPHELVELVADLARRGEQLQRGGEHHTGDTTAQVPTGPAGRNIDITA